ncbi:hypothetical protein SALB1_2797 [Salinisphaera sp. LB1]|nr:hypothetical protein SALB1_2797 [Salinisphaera sp. LB1]
MDWRFVPFWPSALRSGVSSLASALPPFRLEDASADSSAFRSAAGVLLSSPPVVSASPASERGWAWVGED